MASKTRTEEYARERFSCPCSLQMEKTQQVGKNNNFNNGRNTVLELITCRKYGQLRDD